MNFLNKENSFSGIAKGSGSFLLIFGFQNQKKKTLYTSTVHRKNNQKNCRMDLNSQTNETKKNKIIRLCLKKNLSIDRIKSVRKWLPYGKSE